MKKKNHLILCIILLASFSITFGQNIERKWAFAPHIGLNEYRGNLGDEFFSFSEGYGGGFSVLRYLTPSFDVGFLYNYDFYAKQDDNNLTPGKSKLFFRLDMWNINTNFRYKLNNGYMLKEESRLAPYVVAGAGAVYSMPRGNGGDLGIFDFKQMDFALFGGLGIKFVITSYLDLEVQSGLLYPFNDSYDGTMGETIPADDDKYNDRFLQSHIGIVYKFKGKRLKDTDGDGVSNRIDKCPGTPEGVVVDDNGCPVDSDLDGIPDYLDDCPQIAGLRFFQGCPDTDGDGVKDELDKCPDTPENLLVTPDGCPLDIDLDGIYDYEDKCPTIPGKESNNGCPEEEKGEPTEDMRDWFALVSENIHFEYNKSELTAESMKTLNDIIIILDKHIDYKLEISAFADSRGREAYNLDLSEKRAKVTKDYIISQGIDENRISAMGYGESEPIATNMYEWGRRINRRIEFVVK